MEEGNIINQTEIQDESFYFPTQTIIGIESFTKIAVLSKPYGNRVFIITAKHLKENTSLITKLMDSLKANHCEVFVYSQIENNCNTTEIDKIASLLISSVSNFVIGVGNEVVLNATKLSALIATNGLNTEKAILFKLLNQEKFLINAALPTIMIPTLYGTLSESNHYYTVQLVTQNATYTVKYESCYPEICLLDAELTYFFPYKVIKRSTFSLLLYAVQLLIEKQLHLNHKIFLQEIINIVNHNFSNFLSSPLNTTIRNELYRASLFLSYASSSVIASTLYHLTEALITFAPAISRTLATCALGNALIEHSLQNNKELTNTAIIQGWQMARQSLQADKTSISLADTDFDIKQADNIYTLYEKNYLQHHNQNSDNLLTESTVKTILQKAL